MGAPNPVDVAKAPMDSTIFATNGALNPQQFDFFWGLVQERPGFVADIPIQRMDNLKMDLDSLEFGGPITFAASEATDPTDAQSGVMVPTKTTLDAKKIQCEIRITEEMRKTSIVRGQLDNVARDKMAYRHSIDLDLLTLQGDTTLTSNALLKRYDGFLKQSTTNAIDYTLDTQNVSDSLLLEMWFALAAKYRDDKANMRFYCDDDFVAAYNYMIAQRQTAQGDIRMIDGVPRTYWNGVWLMPLSQMPAGTVLLTNRKNCVLGVNEEMIPYVYEQPRSGVVYYGLRYWSDVKFVEEIGTVKLTGANPAGVLTTSTGS